MTEEGFIGSQGKGKLISQEYVYDGEFEKGLAHGYGHFISPGVEYVGEFREGVPLGEGIGKTANEIFIGEMMKNKKKHGVSISHKNVVTKMEERGKNKAATQM